MIKSSRSILVAILLTSGCQEGDPPDPSVGTCIDPDVEKTTLPDLPLARQTEHLDIYSDGFVCAGTSLELERHVTFVADSVGIDLRTHIPVVLSQEPPAQCEGILGTSIAITGCSKPDGAVFSMLTSLYHELNHSAACQLRSGQPRVNALVEGFAVMYEPLHWVSEKNENLTLAELIADETPDYYAAGHFVRWLVEREGPETLADLYRIPSGAEQFPDVLEDLYGLSLEQLEAEYAAAPWKWVPSRQCADLPHAERGPANEWDVMYQSFTFTYDGAGRLEQLERAQVTILFVTARVAIAIAVAGSTEVRLRQIVRRRRLARRAVV